MEAMRDAIAFGLEYLTAGGTANAIALTPSPAITAYADKQRFSFKATGDNSSGVTVAVSGLATKTLKKAQVGGTGTVALTGGEIQDGGIYDIVYDNTDFILLNPSSGGLGSMAAQNANSVAITGGSVVGITDVTVADGGTGSSTAAGARTNLGAAASGANTDITSLASLSSLGTVSSANSVQVQHTNSIGSGYVSTMMKLTNAKTGATDWHFIQFESNGGADPEYRVRGDGTTFADNGYNSSGADYAEYFEWLDGNPNGEDRAGLSVRLTGEKITLAGHEDKDIIGVVSISPSVAGNNAVQWTGRYMLDAAGRRITAEQQGWTWLEDVYADVMVEIPAKGKKPAREELQKVVVRQDQRFAWAVPKSAVPKNAEAVTRIAPVENPDYDPEKEYMPRSDRKEWAAIGLLGQLRVRKGQPTGERWIKLANVNEEFDRWLVR